MLDVSKSDLVAVRMGPSIAWLDVLRHAWDAGAAVLPLDVRLPDPALERLIERARPTVVFDGTSAQRRGGDPVESGIALVMATSGTAAEPKLVELSHDALDAALDAGARRLGSTPLDPWLLCLPVAHMGGMLVLARAARSGAPLTVHERFDPAAVAAADARWTSLVPTIVHRVVRERLEPAALQAALVGGAALEPALAEEATTLGWRCVQTYGLTETCGGIVYDGRPLEGAEIDLDVDGRIRARGPMLFRAYRGEEPRDPHDWFDTRDVGVLEDGLLRVLGRADDVIVTGGVKVWPSAVEEIVRALTGVDDVAIGGTPDHEWGQIVTAYVVPAGEPPSLAEIRSAVADRLGRAAAPRRLKLVEKVPRTTGGKIRRAALRTGHP